MRQRRVALATHSLQFFSCDSSCTVSFLVRSIISPDGVFGRVAQSPDDFGHHLIDASLVESFLLELILSLAQRDDASSAGVLVIDPVDFSQMSLDRRLGAQTAVAQVTKPRVCNVE